MPLASPQPMGAPVGPGPATKITDSHTRAAAQRGVGVDGVAPYRLTSTGPAGLIFGFATVNETAITEGVAILAEVVRGAAPRSG
jgi:DNA-binding transcriptional MocR family regulator